MEEKGGGVSDFRKGGVEFFQKRHDEFRTRFGLRYAQSQEKDVGTLEKKRTPRDKEMKIISWEGEELWPGHFFEICSLSKTGHLQEKKGPNNPGAYVKIKKMKKEGRPFESSRG